MYLSTSAHIVSVRRNPSVGPYPESVLDGLISRRRRELVTLEVVEDESIGGRSLSFPLERRLPPLSRLALDEHLQPVVLLNVEDTTVASLLNLGCIIVYGQPFHQHVLATVVLSASPFHGQIDASPFAVDACQHICHFVRFPHWILVVLEVIERACIFRLL